MLFLHPDPSVNEDILSEKKRRGLPFIAHLLDYLLNRIENPSKELSRAEPSSSTSCVMENRKINTLPISFYDDKVS